VGLFTSNIVKEVLGAQVKKEVKKKTKEMM
jgi:hypothetical protein